MWGNKFKNYFIKNNYVKFKNKIKLKKQQSIFIINVKWNRTLNDCESLHCKPVTYIILYSNYIVQLQTNTKSQ